jgi:DhnA family fructose-bisphosphate aldolase class Ia
MSVLAADGRALIVAMDHARTHGVIEGLEDPGRSSTLLSKAAPMAS